MIIYYVYLNPKFSLCWERERERGPLAGLASVHPVHLKLVEEAHILTLSNPWSGLPLPWHVISTYIKYFTKIRKIIHITSFSSYTRKWGAFLFVTSVSYMNLILSRRYRTLLKDNSKGRLYEDFWHGNSGPAWQLPRQHHKLGFPLLDHLEPSFFVPKSKIKMNKQ